MGSHSSTLAGHSTVVPLTSTSTSRLTSGITQNILTATLTAVSTAPTAPPVPSVFPLTNTEPTIILVTTPIITTKIFTLPTPALSVQAISSSLKPSVQLSQASSLAAGAFSSSISSAWNRTSSFASATARGGATAAAALSGATATTIPAQIETIERVGRGPFAPPDALLGGIPTVTLDVPITAIFLVLFLLGAATHMTIYNKNSKRGHKFILSDLFFDFCMVRTVTTTMRIVWAFRPANNSIVLAALIFENAGVSVLFAVNIVLTQRILRAIHPTLFWRPDISTLFTLLLISVPLFILFNIALLAASFFVTTPSGTTLTKSLLFLGSSWNILLCLLPVLLLPIGLYPSRTPIQTFGTGLFRTKIIMLVYSSLTLFIGSIVRLIAAAQSHPIDDPGQVDSKATFYLTGFTLEIFVVVVFAAARFDLRFWIPDGCTGPGQYGPPPSSTSTAKSTDMDTDKEELLQNIDVKLRMSLPPLPHPRIRNTREQLRAAIRDLEGREGVVGHEVEERDEGEVLVYAFRVGKGGANDGGGGQEPRRPPRSSTWMGG